MKKNHTMRVGLLLLCAGLLSLSPSFAQQNKEDAMAKADRAIQLMDKEQKYDDAIRLLQEAEKLDPGRLEYAYEIAYAYYAQQQYDKAINQLLPLKTRPDAHARVYQLLGNSYDMNKQGTKAMVVYEEGLKKFPTSGELHLELGNMMAKAENYDRALEYYEKGIKADPLFPSNYYWASKLYCSSTEECFTAKFS
jgi:tetratricopeptide (TPR) repeat protein